MSALNATYKLTGTTSNTSAQSLGSFTAPTNQKCWIWIKPWLKDTGTPGYFPFEVRTGTTGGTKNAAVTWAKKNTNDAETVQGSFQTYSAQPTNNGTVVAQAAVRSDRNYAFPPILVHGAGTLDIWVTPSASSIAFEIEIEVEQ